jgi:hypothetical protein
MTHVRIDGSQPFSRPKAEGSSKFLISGWPMRLTAAIFGAAARTSPLPRTCRLDRGILERVYLPTPIFLGQDDQASGFLAGCRHACSLNVEGPNDCYGYIRSDEPQFFDHMAPGMLVKYASRCMEAGYHFGEVFAALDPAARNVEKDRVSYTGVGGRRRMMIVPPGFVPFRQQRPNGRFVSITPGSRRCGLVPNRLSITGTQHCK